jgi:hypothetical protein
MSANLGDIAKLATAANAAKYQGSGTGGWGTALKYLGALAAPLAGAQQTGVVPAFFSALGNVGQVKNESAYNQYLKSVADYERARQTATDTNDAGIFNASTGQNISGPFSRDFATAQTGAIRENNANPSINDLIQGNPLVLNPSGKYDPALISKYLEQQQNVTNSNAAQDLAAGIFGGGQNASAVNGGMNVPGQLQQPVGLDMGGQPALSAGVQQQQAPSVSPFIQAALPVDQIFGQFGRGAQDAQEAGKQSIDQFGNVTTRDHLTRSDSETAKNNRATESIGRTNAQANMISARKPSGGGGSQNPLNALKSLQSLSEGQVKALDKQLMTLGFMDKKGKITDPSPDKYTTQSQWFDGKTATSAADLSKRKMAQALLQKRSEILGGIAGTPFGGESQQNLQSVGTGFSEWKNRQK